MNGPRNLAPARGQFRLLDQVRDVICRLHNSIRTEHAYVDWIRRFPFHGERRPAEIGALSGLTLSSRGLPCLIGMADRP